jgi:putative radical SAM enzyme (TIGR03279 family)
MSAPRVLAVAPGSPASRAGIEVGDEVVAVDGEVPRDIIRWNWLTDEPELTLEVRRGGLDLTVEVEKAAGEPLGLDVHSALFDQLRTCDNHCEFCFIYQLPPGLRKSLYLKDDDYRLSFLYGNFTTLTRFTELDLERVITEGLSPLNVSIHATDAGVRNEMLRNRRGGPTLRWLRALLDHGIEVHGQIVCCPGLNDDDVLDATLAGVLDRFPELASLCVVPLGISRYNKEPRMRATTAEEASAVVDIVAAWQQTYLDVLGHRLVHASDEYYLLAGRPFPEPETYEGFAMHEDGVGMARTFELEFSGRTTTVTSPQAGFFAWADGSPAGSRYEAAVDVGAPADGYRAVRTTAPEHAPEPFSVDDRSETKHVSTENADGGGCGPGASADAGGGVAVLVRPRRGAPVGILTGTAGAAVLAPLLADLDRTDVRVVPVDNEFFGGTTSVTGLLVGADLRRVLAEEPAGHRYLLPDVCLSGDRFLDGTTVADLPRPVEVVATDGAALRAALEA